LLERDGGAPFRGMDSAQRAELAFLRFAQRRLVRPPRARVIAPSEKRQHGKRNRDERNHAPSYHDVRAMENRTSAIRDDADAVCLSSLGPRIQMGPRNPAMGPWLAPRQWSWGMHRLQSHGQGRQHAGRASKVGGKKLVDRLSTKAEVEDGRSVTRSA
jgi:hypothetical protein